MKTCKRCGACCLQTDHVDVLDVDFKRWAGTFLISDTMICEFDWFGSEPKFRRSLAKHIKKMLVKDYKMRAGTCPFFHKKGGKALCLIEDIKPSICRGFHPGSKHAKEFCKCPA